MSVANSQKAFYEYIDQTKFQLESSQSKMNNLGNQISVLNNKLNEYENYQSDECECENDV